jgi:hypothetical protein
MGDERSKYTVGYGKPPTEHQFPRGKSGNPKGRPKGTKNKPSIELRLGMRPTDDIIRYEMLRPIPVKVGDRHVDLPMFQAVLRSLGLNALKGSRLAQRDYMQIAMGREAADYEERKTEFMIAADYKQTWDSKMQQARAAGRSEPTPLPHPADIILDTVRGEARIEGPQTPEEKARLDEALELRTQAQAEVKRCAGRYRRARSENAKSRYLLGWLQQQRLFDEINNTLYPRYKAELEDRFCPPDTFWNGSTYEDLKKKA